MRKLDISFHFRHYWDTPSKDRWKDATFRRFALGVWFKREKNTFTDIEHFELTEWAINMVNSWTIGVDCLVFKAWLTWNATGSKLPPSPTSYIKESPSLSTQKKPYSKR